MRAFLGLEPEPATKLAIESWRSKVLPPVKQAVPAANYHVTLAFLGHITDAQQDKLEQQILLIDAIPQFKVQLDIMVYWAKPKALCLACTQTDKAHIQLVSNLLRAAHLAEIPIQKSDYQAHLTILRKCSENPPAPLIAPDFTWRAEAFHLYESISTNKGVSYVIKKSWPLIPRILPSDNGSIRE